MRFPSFPASHSPLHHVLTNKASSIYPTEQGASWFKPEIGQSTNIIAMKRPDQLRETAEERAHRMSHETASGIEERRRKKVQELYGALTFAPEIDPLSRAIGRTRGLQELTENRSGQRVRDIARMTAERIQESECTFRPYINPYRDSRTSDERRRNVDSTPTCWTEDRFSNFTDGHGELEEDIDGDSLNPIGYYKHSAGGSIGLRSGQLHGKRPDHCGPSTSNLQKSCRMADNIRQHQIEREEKRRADLVAREIEEMKECTFQPSVANYPTGGPRGANHNAAPVLVRGLGRHLELKFLSLKQREEAERREKEVFSVRNIDHFRRVEDGSTIVKVRIIFEPAIQNTFSKVCKVVSDFFNDM